MRIHNSIMIPIILFCIFVLELFGSGYAIVAFSSKGEIESHFAHYSFEHFVELATYHLFGVALLFFIFTHLLIIILLQKSITKELIIGNLLVLCSYGLWFFWHAPFLKIVSSVLLFLLFCFIMVRVINKKIAA